LSKQLDHIKIIFLVSRGRSGSTLIQSILDAHPNICAPIESKFLLHLATKYQKITNWNDQKINQFIKDLYTNRKFRLFWNVNRTYIRNLFKDYHIDSFASACKVVYLSHQSMFEKKEVRLIVDKNPLHSIFIPNILKIFPEAKFIHLIRDPRAATHSHIVALTQKNISQLAHEWLILNQEIEKLKHKTPANFHTITYEALVSTPKEYFKQLFQFLGLPFNDSILDAHQTIKQKYKTSKYLSLAHHHGITNPISKGKIDEWKNKISAADTNLINLICEPLMANYNYSFVSPNYSFSNKITISYGRYRARLKNWLLKRMFNWPLEIRAQLYNCVSLLLDNKFK